MHEDFSTWRIMQIFAENANKEIPQMVKGHGLGIDLGRFLGRNRCQDEK